MKFKRLLSWVFFIFALLFFTGTALQLGYGIFRAPEATLRHPLDNADLSLGRLNSMEKLEAFTDSLALASGLNHADSLEKYVELADSILRMRFYYGLQNYKFSENFLANLAGKYIWSHFGAKVDPNHILAGHKAFCSQSSIVFQELLKRKGLSVRTVRLPEHFCTEVLINGHWGFFDVSYKPDFGRSPRLSTEQLANNPQYLQQAYLYSFQLDFSQNVIAEFDPAKITYGRVNAFPAARMLLFHRITWFFSWFGWAVFLALGVFVRKRRGDNVRM